MPNQQSHQRSNESHENFKFQKYFCFLNYSTSKLTESLDKARTRPRRRSGLATEIKIKNLILFNILWNWFLHQIKQSVTKTLRSKFTVRHFKLFFRYNNHIGVLESVRVKINYAIWMNEVSCWSHQHAVTGTSESFKKWFYFTIKILFKV